MAKAEFDYFVACDKSPPDQPATMEQVSTYGLVAHSVPPEPHVCSAEPGPGGRTVGSGVVHALVTPAPLPTFAKVTS